MVLNDGIKFVFETEDENGIMDSYNAEVNGDTVIVSWTAEEDSHCWKEGEILKVTYARETVGIFIVDGDWIVK